VREHRPFQLAQRFGHAANHALGERLGLGYGDMAKTEAGGGGELRFLLTRRVDLRLAVRQVRDDCPEAECCRVREVAGLERARHGKVRRQVNDPVHGQLGIGGADTDAPVYVQS
jgi:hypothetical protein